MASYIGKHAHLYDVFYSQKDYAAEAAFVKKCLDEFSPHKVSSILELAGGTGKHASFLTKFGYEVLVTDYSQDMLDAGAVRHGDNSRMTFEHWDMSIPKKFSRTFDAAICLFDAIGYVQTNEKVIQTLKNVFDNIKPGGVFICEFWNAGAMLRNFEPYREKKFNDNGHEIVRISETTINYAKQTADVKYTITTGAGEKPIVETQTNRYFLIQEMDHYFRHAGFTPVRYFAGYTDNTNIDSETWHTVAVARKNS